MSAVSLALSAAAVAFLSKKLSVSVLWTRESLLSVVLLVTLFLIFSLVMPVCMIAKSTPKQILSR